MSDNSSIEWTDTTWNPIRGCTRVSEGCRNCYAETMAARFSDPGMWGHGFADRERSGSKWTGKVELIPEKLLEPLQWKKPRRIFVNSMSDLFHESLSFKAIAAVFAVMAGAPQHTYQVLTKRPERALLWFQEMERYAGGTEGKPGAARYVLSCSLDRIDLPRTIQLSAGWPLPNVHIGVSVENQQAADERIPLLLQIPAAVRFLSCEPLLGPVDFTDGPLDPESTMGSWSILDGLDWVIVGGESGPNARPCNVEWIRSIVKQCQSANVPVFVKQLGALPYENCPHCNGWGKEWIDGDVDFCLVCDGVQTQKLCLKSRKGGDPSEWPADLRVREFPA